MDIYIYIYILYMYMYIYIYVCLFIYLCVYIYIHMQKYILCHMFFLESPCIQRWQWSPFVDDFSQLEISKHLFIGELPFPVLLTKG